VALSETVRWAARHGAQSCSTSFHEAEPAVTGPEFCRPCESFHEKAALCRAAENTCFFATVNYASAGRRPLQRGAARTGRCPAPAYGKRGLAHRDVDVTEATGLLRPLQVCLEVPRASETRSLTIFARSMGGRTDDRTMAEAFSFRRSLSFSRQRNLRPRTILDLRAQSAALLSAPAASHQRPSFAHHAPVGVRALSRRALFGQPQRDTNEIPSEGKHIGSRSAPHVGIAVCVINGLSELFLITPSLERSRTTIVPAPSAPAFRRNIETSPCCRSSFSPRIFACA